MNVKSLALNKVVFYLLSRYFTYFIQFVTSLVIAVKLGPYYMGVWGFILLLLTYFQQFHFGIANSLNIFLIHHKDNRQEYNTYISNALVLVGGLSLLVFVFAFYYYMVGIPYIEKFHIRNYMLWICLIAVLQYFNMLFLNILRVRNCLRMVAFNQSVIVFLNFLCVFFFTGEKLIYYLVAGYVVGNVLGVAATVKSHVLPCFREMQVSCVYLRRIFKKGLYLFLYSSCFYFIIISIRTIVSYYYTIEEFGLFTFSFTLAHALLLLLEAVAFVIYPKVIHKLSSDNLGEVNAMLSNLRKMYISSAHLLIYVALCCFPLLIHYIPKYEGAWQVFNLIALSILMNTNSFGFSTLLVARNKERYTALISCMALLANIVLGLLLAIVFKVPFSFVILATLVAYLLFSFFNVYVGKRLLGKFSLGEIIRDAFPLRLWIPYVTALLLVLGALYRWLPVVLLLYLLLNYRDLSMIAKTGRKMIARPGVVDL